MQRPARLLFDISYTRTQAGNMGITRTVRRLFQEWTAALPAQGIECIPVAFNSAGFREIRGAGAANPAASLRPAERSKAAQLFRWVTGETFRRMVVASTALVPWHALRWIWSATSGWTFDALSSQARPVEFRSGDILFLCDASWNYPVWKAARRARAQGAKVVLLVYDLIPLRHPQFCFPLVPHIFGLWLREMLGIAHAVVCISAATEADVRQYAGETGLALPPMTHFRLGSDLPRVDSAAASVRPELARCLQGPAPCFAAIGSFEPKKNYEFLLEVFERLWARGMQVRLLIIGRESAESAELISRLRRHPEQGNRLWTIFDASDAEVGHAYNHCRALVFPSLAEGFGLPLVEARTRGCRVVASNLPVFVELADAGVTLYVSGVHAELEGRITELSAPGVDAKLPPMEPFTWQDSASQCLERMDRLLAAG